MLTRAVPTNQWYSSVVYERWSDVLHAHPLSLRASESGFEIAYPKAVVVPVAGKQPEIQFPHQPALRVASPSFTPDAARLHDAGDWDIQVRMAQGNQHIDAHIAHGSPYVYLSANVGTVRISVLNGARLAAPARRADRWVVAAQEPTGQRWAIFAPGGAQADINADAVTLTLPTDGRFVSVAALPDDSDETLDRFARHAFAFVKRTRVHWRFDEAQALVESRFEFSTQAMDGGEATPIVGLYPHHQKHLKPGTALMTQGHDSARGRIRLAATNEFTTALNWQGILPYWPKLADEAASNRLDNLLAGDVRRAASMFGRMGHGTYWTGKTLGALAHLMNIAERAGNSAAASDLEALLKRRFDTWFSGQTTPRFVYNREIGTVIGYPEEYGSIAAMNDHHFHYGYWIMAAAQLARRDPAWAQPSAQGGLINRLIADIATDERGRKDFPFLRNFDPYAGHSWAGGDGVYFGHGNNQESSSEAINAWAAIVLWAEQTGDRRLRDLGAWMYATEVSAIRNYWLDVDGDILDRRFGKPLASMVFGGKYAYSTWWTEEPRQIQGINLLPITPSSTYLALGKPYLQRFFDGLQASRKAYDASGMSDGTPADIWQDVFASFRALSDPTEALRGWNPRGAVELGETRTRTFHWLHSLSALGAVDLSVRADTALYTVFRRDDGVRTYLAHNPGRAPRTVRFTDGATLTVAPGQLGSLSRKP
jgi:endoglucanase Acf2